MIVVVLGGARSGKSAVAETLTTDLAKRGAVLGAGGPDGVAPISYVATAAIDLLGEDPDFAERIEVHRSRRPDSWTTVEAGGGPALADVLAELEGVVLVDSLGTWVASTPDFAVDTHGLVRTLRDRAARPGHTVLVSEEVGLGVHPSSEIGRQFRDALGGVNQAVATIADQVLLAVAGRVLPLPRAGDLDLLLDPDGKG